MSEDQTTAATDAVVVKDKVTNSEPAEQTGKQPSALSFWQVTTVAAMVSTMVVISALAGYHVYFARANKPKTLGTVDLQQVLQIKEMAFNELLTRPGTTDADRERAYEMLKGLNGEITRAIDDLRVECNCNILVKAAVIGDGDINLTEALKAKMGIAAASSEELQNKVRNNTFGTEQGSRGISGQVGTQPATGGHGGVSGEAQGKEAQ